MVTARIAVQRVRESLWLVQLASWGSWLVGRVLVALGRVGPALEWITRAHRTTRSARLRRRCERQLPRVVQLAYVAPAPPGDAGDLGRHFGKRLLVLKEPGGGERGVLLVMFSELLAQIVARMDVRRLMADYHLVVEPSWSGYCDRDFLFFTQFADPVFVLAAESGDFEFLTRLHSNLIPVPLGPCDWVDPRIAEPYLGTAKRFDVAMNSHWGSFKRHHVLFRAIARLDAPARILLIGGPWAGGTADDIRRLAQHYGLAEQIELYEHIPYARVMELTCAARVSVLMSRKEGSNRALAESMFCDVPVILLDEHVGGIRKNVVPETGLIVPERRLRSALAAVLRDRSRFGPRSWAVAHISCTRSGDRLNELLRRHLIEQGFPWTRDIAHHANSPEATYLDPRDAERLAPCNRGLEAYLL